MLQPDALYGILYLEVNLISVVLLLVVRIRSSGITKMTSQQLFIAATDSMTLFFLSDTVCVLIQSALLPRSVTGLTAAKAVYFFTTVLMCYFWFLYFERMRDTGFSRSPKTMILSALLVAVSAILEVANLFSGFLFSVDSACIYHRGPLFLLQYLLAYVYVAAASVRAFRQWQNETDLSRRNQLVSFILFPLFPGIAGILQFLFPKLPLACAVLSVETLILYLNWLENMISIDPLTHLNNRKQLEHRYHSWMKEASSGLAVLMIDADHFKQINDTYGHLAGDEALLRISEALRKTARRSRLPVCIARYGGDEFILLAKTDSPEQVQKLAESTRQNLMELNAAANTEWKTEISIGTAVSGQGESLETAIRKADEKMYREKQN
ncbi:MAG: GGDEF domain-containing protein [Solobacterium sp.]|nr:GGDEF domain-containing protein [Solobacterium sp.]